MSASGGAGADVVSAHAPSTNHPHTQASRESILVHFRSAADGRHYREQTVASAAVSVLRSGNFSADIDLVWGISQGAARRRAWAMRPQAAVSNFTSSDYDR